MEMNSSAIAVINISDNKKINITNYINSIKPIFQGYKFINEVNIKDNFDEKFKKLVKVYKNPEISLILCSNGGTSSINLLKDLQNIDNFVKNKSKKYIVGCSDCDHVLFLLNQKGFYTINGHTLKQIKEYGNDCNELKKILQGKEYSIKINNGSDNSEISGKVIAGNLQVISMMLNFLDERFFDNKILMLEDHTNDDRMVNYYLNYLNFNGVFDKIKALVIGKLRVCKNKKRIFKKIRRNLNCPIVDIDSWSFVCNNWRCVIKKEKIFLSPKNGI